MVLEFIDGRTGRCPLMALSRHLRRSVRRSLVTQKQTFAEVVQLTAMMLMRNPSRA